MQWLIIGLVIFFATHSIRIVADDWRTACVARIGLWPWKGIYAVISIIGLGLAIWGFSLARPEAAMVWTPPAGMRHATALLTLPAFILMVAGYVPGNRLKQRLGHPMVAGVALWALAHLLSHGSVPGVILFAGFFIWAAIDFVSARRRAPLPAVNASIVLDLVTLVVGTAAWAGFAHYGHALLIGVKPLG